MYDAELFAVARPLLPFKAEPSAAQLQTSGLLTADLSVADVVPLPGAPMRWALPDDETGAQGCSGAVDVADRSDMLVIS